MKLILLMLTLLSSFCAFSSPLQIETCESCMLVSQENQIEVLHPELSGEFESLKLITFQERIRNRLVYELDIKNESTKLEGEINELLRRPIIVGNGGFGKVYFLIPNENVIILEE